MMAISKKTKVSSEAHDCQYTIQSTIMRLSALAQDPDLWSSRSEFLYAIELLEKAKGHLARARIIIEEE